MYPFEASRLEVDLRRYAALLDATDVVSLHRDPRDLFRHLTPCIQQVVSFDVLNFALCDPLRRAMRFYLAEDDAWPEVPLELGVHETMSGWVWEQQQALTIDDVERDTRFPLGLAWLSTRGFRSCCMLPLTTPYERLGALGFASRRTRAFSPQDLEFLKRVAEVVALGIDNGRARTSLIDEKERFQLLLELDGMQMPSDDLDQNISFFLNRIKKWIHREYVGLYIYDKSSGSLRLHMPDPELAKKMAPEGNALLEGTLAGQAFLGQKVEVLNHADLSALPFASVQRGLQMGVKSLCLVPLLSGSQCLGVLKIASHDDYTFTPKDITLLKKVADMVAPALEKALNREPVQLEQQGPFLSGQNFAALPDFVLPVVSPTLGKSVSLADMGNLSDPEQLIAAYFSASHIGVCVLNRELRVAAINRRLAEINGLNPEDYLGKTLREVVGDDFAAKAGPELERVLASGQPSLNFEVSVQLPGREEPSHWNSHYFPLKGPSGNVEQIGMVAVETTQQKKMEESLHELSDKLRQERRRLEVLLEVGGTLAASWNVEQVFLKISAYLRRLLRQEYASFYLYDENSRTLISRATDFPMSKGLLLEAALRVDVDHSPMGESLIAQTPLIFSRDEIAAFQTDFTSGLVNEGIKTSCCVPLAGPTGILGTLHLASTRANAFKSDDLALLRQVASLVAIALENATAAQQIEALKTRLDEEKRYLEGEVRSAPQFEEIVGQSPALAEVLAQVSTVASSDATVLVLGETGTGKELIARAVHRISPRHDRSFIKVNCAAIPTGLLESELFGHEKGAFTGAISQKIGRMELADKGTLFLDEVGEIPLELQPKLLRVLQDQEFERLGSTKTLKVNVRLIAATNRDLSKSVADRTFRSDLFYRLNVFPVRMPSLRERTEDIPLLVRHFVHKYAASLQRRIDSIPRETMAALIAWSWPGNVRELENVIERSVILSESSVLHVPLMELREEADMASAADRTLENIEREHIIRVLRESGGIVAGPAGAAHRLGVKRTTLQSKMQRLGITRENYSGPQQS